MKNGAYPCCAHCAAPANEMGSHARPCTYHLCPGSKETP